MRDQSHVLPGIRIPVAVGLAVAATATAHAGLNPYPPIPIPIVVTTCQCSTFAQLESSALQYATKWLGKTPPGFPTIGYSASGYGTLEVLPTTQVMISSSTYPLSADFVFDDNHSYPVGYLVTPIDASNDTGARAFDNEVHGRAADIPPLHIPTAYPPGSVTADVIGYAQTQLYAVGGPQVDFWHGLTNIGQFVYVSIFDAQTGQTYKLYVGDSVTFVYSNGYTEKFEYLGPTLSIMWQEQTNTLRDANGNVPGKSPPAGSANSNAGASIDWSYYDTGGDSTTIYIYPFQPSTEDVPQGTITIDWGYFYASMD